MQLNSLFSFLGRNVLSSEGDAESNTGAGHKPGGFGAMLSSTLAMLSSRSGSNALTQKGADESASAEQEQPLFTGLFIPVEGPSEGTGTFNTGPQTDEKETAESADLKTDPEKGDRSGLGPVLTPTADAETEPQHHHITQTGSTSTNGAGGDEELLRRSAGSSQQTISGESTVDDVEPRHGLNEESGRSAADAASTERDVLPSTESTTDIPEKADTIRPSRESSAQNSEDGPITDLAADQARGKSAAIGTETSAIGTDSGNGIKPLEDAEQASGRMDNASRTTEEPLLAKRNGRAPAADNADAVTEARSAEQSPSSREASDADLISRGRENQSSAPIKSGDTPDDVLSREHRDGTASTNKTTQAESDAARGDRPSASSVAERVRAAYLERASHLPPSDRIRIWREAAASDAHTAETTSADATTPLSSDSSDAEAADGTPKHSIAVDAAATDGKGAEAKSAQPKAVDETVKLGGQDVKTTEARAATGADAKASEANAAEPKADEVKSAEVKSAEVKSAEAKAADAKPADAKVAEAKSADAKPADAKAAELKSAEPKTTDAKVSEAKATHAKASEGNAAEPKATDAKAAEPKAADAKAADAKATTAKAGEAKTADVKSVNVNVAETEPAQSASAEAKSATPKNGGDVDSGSAAKTNVNAGGTDVTKTETDAAAKPVEADTAPPKSGKAAAPNQDATRTFRETQVSASDSTARPAEKADASNEHVAGLKNTEAKAGDSVETLADAGKASERAVSEPAARQNADERGDRGDGERTGSRTASGANDAMRGETGQQRDFMAGSDAQPDDAFDLAAQERTPDSLEFDASLNQQEAEVEAPVDAEIPVDFQASDSTERLTFTPERTPTSTSTTPLADVQRAARPRPAANLNWMRAMLEDTMSGVSVEEDWKVLEMKLDEGQGTMTVRARRDEDKMSITVNFTDPQLRALAAEHADQLQETLRAQYQTQVDFSLMSDNAGQSRDPDAEKQQNSHRSSNSSSTGLSEPLSGADRARATRAALAGARNEWIG